MVKPLPEGLDQFLRKGPKFTSIPEDEKVVALCLRLPDWMLQQVNEKYKKRVGLTRTAWLLEAIQKHLENP